MSRRKGRILAFQALYSWDVSKASLEDLLTFSWLQKDSEIISANQKSEEEALESETSENIKNSEASKEAKLFASLVISGTIEHILEIDEKIKTYLSASWSMERINKVSLAVLRSSIYELVYQKDSEPKIVIDEAINIAKRYGSDDSYKFINAVLDKIAKNELS